MRMMMNETVLVVLVLVDGGGGAGNWIDECCYYWIASWFEIIWTNSDLDANDPSDFTFVWSSLLMDEFFRFF